MEIIKATHLTKQYRVQTREKGFRGVIKNLLMPAYQIRNAVNDISFTVNQGEFVGIIGPNGAGKSTTVKMLTGILEPTSGEVLLNGLCPARDRKKCTAGIGVAFGQRTQLWWDLPVSDTFDLLKHIYRIPPARYKSNLERFISLLGMEEFIRQPVRQLSLGQRMRADIAASLLHDPAIVLFDEPTVGLDVVARDTIREFLLEINRENKVTVLLTTHDLGDVEKMCRRMIIIDHGKIIYDGSVEAIREQYGNNKTLVVEFNRDYGELDLPQARVVDTKGTRRWIAFNKNEVPVTRLINHLTNNYGIVDLSVKEPEIETIIKDIYRQGYKPCTENI